MGGAAFFKIKPNEEMLSSGPEMVAALRNSQILNKIKPAKILAQIDDLQAVDSYRKTEIHSFLGCGSW